MFERQPGIGRTGDLLGGGFQAALQLAAARSQLARLKLRFLRLALQCTQLLAGVGQPAVSSDHGILELGVALLGGAELDVEFLEAALACDPPCLDLVELCVELRQLAAELLAPAVRGVGLLGQAQQLHLQLVGAGLRLGRVAAGRGQALGGIGVGRLQAHRAGTGLVGNQRLRALAAFEVLDLLRPRQHPGLFGVGGVEGHRELRDAVPLAHHDDLAMREPVALRQGFVQARGRVDALEPVVEQGGQAGVVQAQQIGQARQCPVRVLDRRRRRRVEGQLGRRRVGSEGAHDVQPSHRQRVEPLAQGAFQRGLPAGLDVHRRVHSPCRPSSPCLASQGLSLPSVCTFSCSARSASSRAVRSASCPASRLHAGGRLAALLVEPGTLVLQLVQAGLGGRADLVAAALRWVRSSSRSAVGRTRAWRSPARRSRRACSWRVCSSRLRLSAASSWICCCTSDP
jgi:hypothetical protein